MNEDVFSGSNPIAHAVAEGWVMKNIPRVDDDSDCLCYAIFCFIVIAIIIILAFVSGWFSP